MANRPMRQYTRVRKPAIRIILAPMPAHWAQCRRTVWVDPRTPLPHRRLLAALIQVEHPDWSVVAVKRNAEYRWQRMTSRQKAHLLRMFGRAKVGGEDE